MLSFSLEGAPVPIPGHARRNTSTVGKPQAHERIRLGDGVDTLGI